MFGYLLPPSAIHGTVPFMPLAIVWFVFYSLRIVLLPGSWSFYFPLVSPDFGSGQNWASSPERAWAIVAHVLSGAVVLVCGFFQLDKALRQTRPHLHRWTGRCYVLAGLIMVASLRTLRAGSSEQARNGQSLGQMLFVDAASFGWLLSTALAVFYAAVRRDFTSHRKWAVTGVFIALVPVVQRIAMIPAVPAVMAARMGWDAVWHGVPFWQSAWGDGVPIWQSVWGDAPSVWFGPPVSPLLLSLEGYGVAQNICLVFSAWGGFLLVLYLIYVAAWSSEDRLTKEDSDASLEEREAAIDATDAQADRAQPCPNTNAIFELSTVDVVSQVRRYLPTLVFACGKVYLKELYSAAVDRSRRFVMRPCMPPGEKMGTYSLLDRATQCGNLALVIAGVTMAVIFAVLWTALATAGVGALVAGPLLTLGAGGAYPAYIARGYWFAHFNSTSSV